MTPSTPSADLKNARRQRAASPDPRATRVPPASMESEQAALGLVLMSPNESLPQIQAKLPSVEAFYDLRHQEIYKTYLAMQEEREAIDTITVQQKLKDWGLLDQIGGIAYLNAIQDAAVSAANLTYWLDIIEEKWTLRKLIVACTDAVARVYDHEGDLNGLLDEFEKSALSIRPTKRATGDIKTLVNQAIEKIEFKFNHPYEISGFPTGLIDLDKKSDGIHRGEMVVVAGFTSTGKTALSVGIAVHNAVNHKLPVAVFSAEMLPVQLALRALCSTAQSNYKHITENDYPKLTSAAGRISKAPIYIEPANGMSIGQVQAIARRLKQKHGIAMIVIDYIQLLKGTGDNREQEIRSISQGVKSMALELDCAVLALSQLNDDGRMRESRTISHDADSVWKLANQGEWEPQIQPIELNIEKCRDGETGSVDLVFFKTQTRFGDSTKVKDEDVP